MKRIVALLTLAAGVAGCYPGQPSTNFPAKEMTEPKTGRHYTLYVPSYYTPDRSWPVVIPLHGTPGFDSPDWQMLAWKDTAEKHGLIVAAPQLRSAQGILPKVKSVWFDDLASDEQAILAIIDDLDAHYKIDRSAVLMTAFSAGGYPMYWTGLRNPTKFQMLIAGAANSSMDIFDKIGPSADIRKLRISIIIPKDDLPIVREESWEAYRWLRNDQNRCYDNTDRQLVTGGHYRRPEFSYKLWSQYLPLKYKM